MLQVERNLNQTGSRIHALHQSCVQMRSRLRRKTEEWSATVSMTKSQLEQVTLSLHDTTELYRRVVEESHERKQACILLESEVERLTALHNEVQAKEKTIDAVVSKFYEISARKQVDRESQTPTNVLRALPADCDACTPPTTMKRYPSAMSSVLRAQLYRECEELLRGEVNVDVSIDGGSS
jgi:uncharacterized protein YoxC